MVAALQIVTPCLRRSVKQYLSRSLTTYDGRTTPKKGDKVVVGMSGGVDSSVAARLLVDHGYDLSAVYMRNWDTRDEFGTDRGCEWEKDWEDVQRVCRKLDIPCSLIDLSREYWNRVFEPSLYQWEMGVTPNPDVWCNKEIKFGALLERLTLDFQTDRKPWFATGHYARKDWSVATYDTTERPRLLRSADDQKDQSYYLSSISENGLGRALFPLGHLTKREVRQLAKEYDLPTAERPESMGICFVGEKTRFSKFLSSYIPSKPGPIYDISTNKQVGQHDGLWNYTIGENARIGGMPARMFVARKDPRMNAIYVAAGSDNSSLYCTTLRVTDYRWIWADRPPRAISEPAGFRAHVMYRYRMKSVPCTVHMKGHHSNLVITFDESQKSVSAGQVAAIWEGDCLPVFGVVTFFGHYVTLRSVCGCASAYVLQGMSGSRAESQQSHYGRRRSNTAQSVLRPLPQNVSPIKVGESKVLNLWVHDVKDSPSILFNQSWWPGVTEGDLLRVMCANAGVDSSFLFVVPKDDGSSRPQLQISIPKPLADAYGLRNNGEVMVTKEDRWLCRADYVEFVFQDQYLGRSEMWRLVQQLVGQCIHTNQEVTFIGGIIAKILAIYIGGKKVSSACMTPTTKAIFRSLSARVTIFIQVCHELWEFTGDGQRYNEKIVHSFLPALFAKWRESGTNHTVTIVLISRVYYEESEIDYAAGPLRCDERGQWYKDFYKIITDLEVIYEWKPTLVSLKNSFWDFQRDILLTHHYHRATQDHAIGPSPPVRLVGRLTYAHDGPILEALNLALNPSETHYIDRSLSLTGAMTLLISPGTGYFRVSKKLLRLTTTRMLDQGFILNLVLLTKPPLHQSPVFSFQGTDPGPKPDINGKFGPHTFDPLWDGEDESSGKKTALKTYWWEPFWVSAIYWDQQMDLPFRQDRFVPRAKMHQIQMLGLLEHDVLSSIEVPYLSEMGECALTSPASEASQLRSEAEKFDLDIFALKRNLTRELPTANGHYRSATEKRSISAIPGIQPIEEVPKQIVRELPPEGPADSTHAAPSTMVLSTSPSQSSIRSTHTNKSGASAKPSSIRSHSKASLTSRLTPSWLFNPFRSAISEPQTSRILASATTSRPPPIQPPPAPAITVRAPSATKSAVAPSPLAIKKATPPMSRASNLSRAFDEDMHIAHRQSFIRRSPVNTPPRDDGISFKRRNVSNPLTISMSSSSPGSATNPSQIYSYISYTQSSLARRWQHMLPQKLHKYDMKWNALVTPPCLPLTVEYFPSQAELDYAYEVFSYDFVVDPREMRSFLVNPPATKGTTDDMRRTWALAVMQGMAAVRLAQGFQFVLKPQQQKGGQQQQNRRMDERATATMRPLKSFMTIDEDLTPKPAGAAEVLRWTTDPVYLSMSNEIHRISYTGEAIQVRRYVRRMLPAKSFEYQCLIWPKLGGGYTELSTTFSSRGLENYGWNRMDMLVAGYEQNFNESMRYWRTRFVVIPTSEPPMASTGPSGEKLDDEEIRILGIDKLAEQFTKSRWHSPDERPNQTPPPPVRFLPTTLDPVASVLDESLMEQLDAIHAMGPLKKKMKSEREIGDMSLAAIAKAMRDEDGVPIKNHQWHRSQYPNSFVGFDFVSWLVREFRDVSSRAQAAELGAKLQEQGLFEHCRGLHGFLDGHYFYRLKDEYSVPMTPKGWFRRHAQNDDGNPRSGQHPSSATKPRAGRRNKKCLILSQSMVIDVDPNKRSDQAESVVLHHDIIHNPATIFHFELQWIGTTARCIEDTLRQWNRAIERYGLRLVEAYVTQIYDIRDRNAFQSWYPLRLAVPPPVVPDLEKKVPEGTRTTHYFEYALLRRFGFILDVEAADSYPEQIDVVYSYRRSAYTYSQFVHWSGVAFVQVLGGTRGFIFLTNRLMGPGRMGSMKSKDNGPASAAEDLRQEMDKFCDDPVTLMGFYDEELASLGQTSEEPPPLSI
ncbi:hypothetical protein AX17_005425 [Amanita inopinata Kibby_2008]|nr:hypothetical protein AX17_005425 [Amanita inopinata Kibby_2008]